MLGPRVDREASTLAGLGSLLSVLSLSYKLVAERATQKLTEARKKRSAVRRRKRCLRAQKFAARATPESCKGTQHTNLSKITA